MRWSIWFLVTVVLVILGYQYLGQRRLGDYTRDQLEKMSEPKVREPTRIEARAQEPNGSWTMLLTIDAWKQPVWIDGYPTEAACTAAGGLAKAAFALRQPEYWCTLLPDQAGANDVR